MYLGIDAGASATKAALIDESERIISYAIVPSGIDFMEASRKALEKALSLHNLNVNDLKYSVATGYGRRLIKADSISTEILCIAKAAYKLYPSVRTIIDVGGQDSKAIRIDKHGKVTNFVMNDKCAAGTGRFLEVMSNIIGVKIDELSTLHFKSTSPVKITSTCTVFAESEVVSYLSQGYKIEDIIAGLHNAIADRIYLMASTIGFEKEVLFTGGVAKNKGFVESLSQKMGIKPILPKEPQIICAYGAALTAKSKVSTRNYQGN